ncbi:hypothetical protein PHYPO_G00144550 [Pangasianodon hypophthalmus]|uniref:Uncharacterized protein n=1 Tax=Pangasianodon hypophthalmus TaxID=310915 RepID=A0A5N5K8I5_PANHP|nr:hypothetical protein PHYPO_G00144550 [Pangasianodon hypophthalmus]
MSQGSKTLVFFINQSGKFLDAQREIVERLKKRLEIREVDSVDKCDVIIAFVPIVSRAGTDIEAALQNIPTTRPVVLVVFHHTFDENYIAPQSKLCVKKEDVFAADFLCHEDVGLLKCLANDEALKSITDYLISMAPSSPLIPVNPRPRRRYWTYVAVSALVVAVSVLLIYFLVKKSQGKDDTLTTQRPNITVTT